MNGFLINFMFQTIIITQIITTVRPTEHCLKNKQPEADEEVEIEAEAKAFNYSCSAG